MRWQRKLHGLHCRCNFLCHRIGESCTAFTVDAVRPDKSASGYIYKLIVASPPTGGILLFSKHKENSQQAPSFRVCWLFAIGVVVASQLTVQAIGGVVDIGGV